MKGSTRVFLLLAAGGIVVWALWLERESHSLQSQKSHDPPKGLHAAPVKVVSASFEPEVTESGSPPSPAEVIAGMKVPEGFRVELFASEPEVRVPIDLTVDDSGRVWVAEAYSYMDWPRTYTQTTTDSNGMETHTKVTTGAEVPRDRIVVLSDIDGDGHADERTVAISGLKHLCSVAVGWGGVWVLNLPNLEFYPDANGDGVVEGGPSIKVSGFTTRGRWNMPNSLTWGPDGWLYGLSGQLGWSYVRDQQFSCGVWRYHPIEDRFEVVANGMTNPWGIDWNAEGDCFVSGNCNGHLWAIHHGGYYERGWGGGRMTMGSNTFSAIEKVPHYPPDSTWRAAWERRFEKGSEADAYGGGHSHCGLLIYQGGRWPAKYQGRTLMANTFGRRLNVDTLDWEGRYLSERQEDLMKANTEWFKGVSVEQDVDGNVLASDWCDKGECHDQDGVHRSSGRIYRLVYGESSARKGVDLGEVKDDSLLLDLLRNQNNYYQRRASRILMERSRAGLLSNESEKALVTMASEAGSWQERVLALQTLAGGGKLNLAVSKALSDSETQVRAAAVRLLASEERWYSDSDGEMKAQLKRLFEEEKSERVLWQLAAMLRHSNCSLTNVFLLLPRSNHPRLTRLLWQATGGEGRLMESDLLKFYQLSPDNVGRLEAIAGLVDLAASDELAQALKSVSKLKVEEGNEVLAALGKASSRCRPNLSLPNWRILREDLLKRGNKETTRHVIALGRVFRDDEAFAQAQRIAQDRSQTSAERTEALQQMLLFDSSRCVPEFLQAWAQPEMRSGLIPLLTELGMGFSFFVSQPNQNLSAEQRQALVKEMLESSQGAAELMNEIEAGFLSPKEMQGGNLALLEVVAPELAEQFRKQYGTNTTDELWKRARQALAGGKGDSKVGEGVFERLCSSCHQFRGGVAELGPDLSGYDFRESDALLRSIVYPSETVAPDAQMMVVKTTDGTVVVGMSLGVTVRGDLRLKTALGEMVVSQSQTRSQETLAQSLMPEGLLEGLNDEEIRGLFQYLQGGEQ